jgi:hypothetical protein
MMRCNPKLELCERSRAIAVSADPRHMVAERGDIGFDGVVATCRLGTGRDLSVSGIH